MPLKSVICLSQKRVNDRFHAAAVPHRAGEMSPHTGPHCSPQLCRGKDSRTQKVPACPWRGDLGIGTGSQGQQRVGRGRYKQAMERDGTSSSFSPCFSDSQKK